MKHKALVSCVDISDDGLVGISGSYDRSVCIWNLLNGECLREITAPSFVVNISMT
jgi:WD40 repeat protein